MTYDDWKLATPPEYEREESGAPAAEPFGLSPERKAELDAQWEAAGKTYCLECGRVFADHYWAGDCANDRQVDADLGAATTTFLEGMAAPVKEDEDIKW